MSELREKAIEEVCRRGVATGDSDETMLGYFAERALLAEQQRDQARELLLDLLENTSHSSDCPGCDKVRKFLAPPAADAQEGS
jgi:hypothetical protein